MVLRSLAYPVSNSPEANVFHRGHQAFWGGYLVPVGTVLVTSASCFMLASMSIHQHANISVD